VIELKKILFESLKNYKNFRPYTMDEIMDEVEEYHSNEYTKGKLPKMWKDKDDGISDIKTSSHEFLSDSELKSLQNSDVNNIMNSDDKLKTAINLSKKYKKNYKSILDGLKKKVKFPPPLVVKDKKDSLYLLGGNTRLMLGIALGYNLPVKIIPWNGEIK
jgi:RNAse (barnase) inhibitor barstar|tara:strand:+ start:1828 stop:2307 length:480 start_codon:yes stop_codon:yes gene_type:complete